MPVRIQFRRGTAAEWQAANPVLMEGELGFETDTGKWKIGNGINAWNELEHLIETPLGAQAKVDEHEAKPAPHSGHATTIALDTHLADIANPHTVTAAQIPYASTVAGFDPTLVSGALDVLVRDGATWRRVDALSGVVEITSNDWENPTIVPLSKPYSGTSIYAVSFWLGNADDRRNNIAFFKGTSGASAGSMIAGVGSPGARRVCLVFRIRVPGQDNAIGFFSAIDLEGEPVLLYVASVFAVKEGV